MTGNELVYWIDKHPKAVRSIASKYTSDEQTIDDIEQEVYFRLLNSQATFVNFSAYYGYCKKVVSELADKHISRISHYAVIADDFDFPDEDYYPDPDGIANYYVRHLKKRNPNLLDEEEWRVLFTLVNGNRYAHYRDHENKISKNRFKRIRSSIARKLASFTGRYMGLQDIYKMKKNGMPIREITKVSGWSDGTLKRKLYV